MKITETQALAIPDIKVITFARFRDHRGYFTEPYRRSDLQLRPELSALHHVEFLQCNESFSRRTTLRGLHFQWNPFMGKLVRTISGRMLDIVLDIRLGSPTYGKALLYDMPADETAPTQQWIWVPPGFAHGNLFLDDTRIEYLCTGEYNQACEAGISPYAADIDWTLADAALLKTFRDVAATTLLVTDKDRNGASLTQWGLDERSQAFDFTELAEAPLSHA